MTQTMCDNCDVRTAQVTFQVAFGGKKVVRNYCPQCAAKLRRGDVLGIQLAVVNSLPPEQVENVPACPKCGMTMERVQKTGRMGCAACYRAFSGLTEELLKKLNGTERQLAENIMETPVMSEEQQRLRTLREELAQAVSIENYERAAMLRDEINGLSMRMEAAKE